jgi:hypothetical protein
VLFCTTLEYQVLVTLPLWVLSVTFHLLLPMAISSLVLSLAVCAAAGAQAALPRTKRRWWSRPLVATLFFLQPIVRGWARYRGRLMRRPTRQAPHPSLDSMALRASKQSLREVRYWAEEPVDRLAFAADILRRLDQRSWPNKCDIGWSDYDVEIHDTRWTKLQLTTVAEEHPHGKQLIRCRLRARWSLRSRVTFWLLGGLELLICGLMRHWLPWLWVMLLTLPLFVWFIRRQKRNLQSIIVVFLDDLAEEWRLAKAQP